MTDFSNVRIPATRLGSGLSRSSARIRRHVTKGFYDVPPGATGSITVNEVTAWATASTAFWNVYIKDITANTTEGIAGPGFAGQVLILELKSGGTTYDWTVTGSFRYDGTDYTQAVFGDDKDFLLLLGLKTNTTNLQWFVWGNATITVTLS